MKRSNSGRKAEPAAQVAAGFSAHFAIISTFALAGCGDVTGLPAADPVPVVRGTVVAGESRHILRAEWSSPTDEPFPLVPQPIAPADVALWLVGPGEDSVRYMHTGLDGVYAATLLASAASAYRLTGVVAGDSVEAVTHLPGPFIADEPGPDTLRFRYDMPDRSETPFRWSVPGAASFELSLVGRAGRGGAAFQMGGNFGGGSPVSNDTVGTILLFPPRFNVPDTARLIVTAYDSATAAFFSAGGDAFSVPAAKGNIDGAFGLFGSVTQAEWVVLWE